MSESKFEPGLVPELLVASTDKSIAFWVELCGFSVRYERPDEGFAYLTNGTTHLMLDQEGVGRDWTTGKLERPLGRGMNLQIAVPNAAALAVKLTAAGWALFMPLETKWYLTGSTESGVEQFLVQDPDGYLVRFQSTAGSRSAPQA